MAPSLTTQLVSFFNACNVKNIPPSVLSRAKMYTLDYLGVTLTGSASQSSKIVADVAQQLGGREECTIIGHDYHTSSVMAGLVNGTAGHAVEMDDDHRTSVLHPAVAVIPAALAAAESANAPGSAALEGVVTGYEAMTRIGDAFLGTQYYEGFHPTGTCGVFGAVAAAGKVLGLNEEQMINAFGIAGTQACGLEEWKTDGSWIKRFHAGKAAEGGLLAALMAKRGYTGPATILEGEHGFLKAFSFERKWDTRKITDGLNTEYRGYGTSFKPYAGCRFFHQVIDAVLALKAEGNWTIDQIEKITVRVYKTAYLTLFRPEKRRYKPGTVVDAQFSIPYAVAISILHGRPVPAHFSDTMIKDAAILDLASKVVGIPDDDYEAKYPQRFPTEVTIRLKDGSESVAFRDLPTGDPENPIYAKPGRFEEEMREKFALLLSLQPQYADRAKAMIDAVSNLEQQPNVSKLMAMFTPRGA